ncbi:GNAT family N-acetyltransferase [bacterium]|nr:GNAT family N-acetyltransferase [bacterium]MBU1434848.1 GNAT family N-acetyltransferase [bacterium]MBU1503953.1 GNAT family N-acetyltransferase [bacterium]
MHYQFIHVINEEILDKVHRFRYKVYEEMGWIDDNPDAKNGKERDAYDDYCDQFAVLNAKGEICCSMRLIHHSPIGYPTEHFLNLEYPQHQFDREKLAEMSRILIDPKHRNMHESKIFISTIVKSLAYEKMKEHGVEYCYGLLEPAFIKLVNMFKIPYQPICELKQVYNKLKYPSILYVKELEEQNPQLEKLL